MTAFVLRLIALISMLLDHIGYVLLPHLGWLRCLGRLSFPIFAFQLTEGYHHTHCKWRYGLRLLLFAVLSEVPFDLMAHGVLFFPAQQNILWTLLLGFAVLHLTELARQSTLSPLLRGLVIFLFVFLAAICATILGLDYGGLGILQIFAFHILRTRHKGITALCILLLNLLMGGTTIQFVGFSLPMQALALLAMIPISLSSGQKGPSNAGWTWFCYLFYPAHMVLLSLLRLL